MVNALRGDYAMNKLISKFILILQLKRKGFLLNVIIHFNLDPGSLLQPWLT